MTAGNDLNKSVAMIAAANKVVQDPSQVGAALRTISLRLRGTSLQVLEEMGEETDGAIEGISKMQEKVKAITGVDIIDANGAYRDTYSILKDIASVWDEVGEKDPLGQASLIELLAGKNRANVLAAIITNLEDLTDAYDYAIQAEGSAQRELDTYLNSIDGRVDKFTNALQTMWMNAISTDIVKWFVDAGTTIITIFDKFNQINPLGIFGSLVAVGGALFGAWKGLPALWKLVYASTQTKIAGIVGETAAIEALNAAEAKNRILNSAAISDDIKAAAISTILTTAEGKETLATNLNTTAKIRDALATKGITGANADAIISALGLSAANTTLTGSFTAVTASVKKLWAAFLASPLAPIAAGLLAIGAAAVVVDVLTLSFKEAKEQLKATSDEISDIRSNLTSLNTELNSINEKIDELQNKGTLTLAEEDELSKLKAERSELEGIIDAEKQREEILKNQQARDALATYERDKSFKEGTTPTTGEYYNAVGQKIGPNTSLPEVDRDIANLKKNRQDLEEAEAELKARQEALLEAQKNGDEHFNWWAKTHGGKSKEQKAYEEALARVDNFEKAVVTSESALSDIIAEREALYGDVGFFYGDDISQYQKDWNEAYTNIRADAIKAAIAQDESGRAIANGFKEISNREFFDDELKSITETAGITGEKLFEMMNADTGEDPYGMKGFIQTLINAGVIADATEDELQKVVDLAIMQNEGASDAEIANKRLARSQKRLEYYKLAKDLNKYTNRVKDLTDTQKDEVKTIKTKMSALAAEIDAYDILGAQVEEAKQSFAEFEDAQTADSESDFTDDVSSMLKTIVDGYQSAEMGSEAFKSAFKSLIPKSVYDDIDTLQGKYEAAATYIRDTLSDYFKIEYDDDGLISSIEVTTKNVQNFIEDAKEKGLMNFANGVWEVTETDFTTFAEKMGVTEEMLVALGEQMDKIDADWITGDLTSFFDSFEMDTESQIYKNVQALAALDTQLINGEITLDEYAAAYKEYTSAIATNTNDAIDNIQKYNDATIKVDTITAQLEEAQKILDQLNSDPNADEKEIQIQTTNVDNLITQLGVAIQAKGELTAPSLLEIEFAQDSVAQQITSVQNQLTAANITFPAMIDGKLNLEEGGPIIEKDGKYVVDTSLEGLDESELALLQQYADLANTQGVINVYVESSEDAQEKVDNLKQTADDIQKVLENLIVKIETAQAIQKLKEIKSLADSLKDKTVNVTTYTETVDKGTRKERWYEKLWPANVNGTAHADGNWGAGVSTSKALVGELGPELRVRNGKYQLLGENGAEFTDVRPNDIIFNH